MSIADLRREYSHARLDEADVSHDPIVEFARWFAEAQEAQAAGQGGVSGGAGRDRVMAGAREPAARSDPVCAGGRGEGVESAEVVAVRGASLAQAGGTTEEIEQGR